MLAKVIFHMTLDAGEGFLTQNAKTYFSQKKRKRLRRRVKAKCKILREMLKSLDLRPWS